MPFINVQMLEGRTEEQIEKVIENITATVAETLQIPKETIRIVVSEVPRSRWGVGGLPVSKINKG